MSHFARFLNGENFIKARPTSAWFECHARQESVYWRHASNVPASLIKSVVRVPSTQMKRKGCALHTATFFCLILPGSLLFVASHEEVTDCVSRNVKE